MVSSIRDASGPFLETALLAGVDEESRVAISRALSGGKAPSGFVLVAQGKPNDRLWFVAEGGVAVERTTPDGRTDVLASMIGPAIYGTSTFFRRSALSATLRAKSELVYWTLDHRGHDRLRLENPRAAEALALSVVQALSERFDQLDRRLTERMAEHVDDHPRATEWADFRARLFEEPSL